MLPPAAFLVVSGEASVPGKSEDLAQVVSGSQNEGFVVLTQENIESPASSVGDQIGKVSEQRDLLNQGVSQTQGTKVPPVKKSWLNVARKYVFTKQKFVVDAIDGQERVVVPREFFVDAKRLREDFLIGKFLSTKAPHVGKIHMIVNKIWNLGDKSTMIDVYEVNATTIKFRIRNESMRQRILSRGMWNIMDIPMVVSKSQSGLRSQKTLNQQ